MTPAERAQLIPHAAGLIGAAHTDDPTDMAHQLSAVAETLDDAATWALLLTLARAVDPEISVTALQPDSKLLDAAEKAWARRADTVARHASQSGRETPRLAAEGSRARRRTGQRKDDAA